MKTTLKLLAISCVCVLVMGACGSGSNENDSTQEKKLSAKKNYRDDYRKACEDLEFGEAHKILDKLRDVFVNDGLSKLGTSYYQDPCLVVDIKGYKNYVDADLYIFREEVAFLMGLDSPDAETKIFKLLLDTPLDGTKLPEGKCEGVAAAEGRYYNNFNKGERVWLYHYCIDRFNQKCDIIVELSILLGKQQIAAKALSYFKEDMMIEHADIFQTVKVKTKNGTVEINDSGYIWYDTRSKDAAQKKYDEAVKNGVFKQ